MAKHPSGCEEAERNKCVCQTCVGALHRWSWCLKAATEPSGEMRRQRRTVLESAWVAAEEKKDPAMKAEVAVNCGVIDIVDWLAEDYLAAVHEDAEHSAAVVRLRAGLAGLVGNAVRDEIDQLLGPVGPSRQPNPVRIALADHFWCDLFAAIAHLAARYKADLDNVPDEVAKIITDSRSIQNNLVRPSVATSHALCVGKSSRRGSSSKR